MSKELAKKANAIGAGNQKGSTPNGKSTRKVRAPYLPKVKNRSERGRPSKRGLCSERSRDEKYQPKNSLREGGLFS